MNAGGQPDPRVAATTVTGGPPDLVGQHIVAVDAFVLKGETLHIPRPLAGVPEFVAVAQAETRARALRRELLETLVDQGPARWQPNTTLVVEMRAAAESAIVTAVVGLEAFCSYQIETIAVNTGVAKLSVSGKLLTPEEIRDLHLDQRYKEVLPALMNVSNPAGKKWWAVLRRVQALAALTRHAIYAPVERGGLSAKRPLGERFLRGEHEGAAEMMFRAFRHYVPGWIADDRLHEIGQSSPELTKFTASLTEER